MSAPLVSIITIVFNGERHLEQAIRSVIGQSYPNIQYILVDGGSTDGSVSIIRQYKDRVAYWISEKDKGISDAFNKGLARCDGEIVGILNADDWYEPDAVALAVQQLAGADVAFGDIRLWRDEKQDSVVKGNLRRLDYEMTLNHPTVFVRKRCYDRYGGFDLHYRCAMDYDLLLRLKVNNCRFVYVPAILANMRWGGMSDEQWRLGCRETLEIKNNYLPDRKWQNTLYYIRHVGAVRANKFFNRVHLVPVIRWYRRLFSRMEKIQ
ncbi:MAG TPA: glycosyltransferase family 2 protein [Puia sp.]|nr:glycosyltransferase family 2 protein [Puia sp.]